MAYTSEIEKLEARYRENPKGRNFAPLADAYRKAGLIDNAIELCQAGLQLHPDYVSGHIVHGRCLVDKKDDTGAEGVFRRVLDLDPENILALRVLAEIAERNDRFDVAAEWLNRLLMADPMNGEAAEGLSRVRGKTAAVATQPTPTLGEPVATMLMEAETSLEVVHEELQLAAPSDSPVPPRLSIEYMEGPFDAGSAEAPTAAMDRPEFAVERASEPPPESTPVLLDAGIETFDGATDFGTVAQKASVPEGIQFDEPVAPEPDPEIRVDGLARTQYEGSGMFKLSSEPPTEPAEAFEDRTTSPMSDLPLIMPEDVEPQAHRTPATGALSALGAPPPAPLPPSAILLPDDDGAADTATLSHAEPVVTETMAALYLQQGHREDALRVYEALSAQQPHDPRLRRKVADLSASRPATREQSAGAFLKGILSARPGAPPPPPSPEQPPAPVAPPAEDHASVVPMSQPAAPLGQGDAHASAESQPLDPGPGNPTRPASDAISLDSVFGEEGGRGSVPAPPEPTPDKPSKLPEATGGFSFDDFFGTSAAPATGAGKGSTANSRSPRPSGRTRSPEQEEDLDQFQAWLKSLKA